MQDCPLTAPTSINRNAFDSNRTNLKYEEKSVTKHYLHLKAFSANLLSSIAMMTVAISAGIRVEKQLASIQLYGFTGVWEKFHSGSFNFLREGVI